MKKLFTLFAFIFLVAFTYSQEKMLVRIDQPSKTDHLFFIKGNYDIAAFKPEVFLDLVVNKAEYNDLKSQGFAVSILQTEEEVKQNFITGKSLNGYRTYEDMLSELQQIESLNPGICKLFDIGDSQGKLYMDAGNNNYANYNHEIWALKLSDNVNMEEDEPAIFYMATHHAREPISLEVNFYILNHLVSNYGSDPVITEYVNNTQIWFAPLVNPNGHRVVTDEDDLWWRKNIRDNNENNQFDLNSSPDGVDPNRNYGWEWGGQGTSNDIYDILYHGPSPFSEPETQAMKSLIESHHFVAGITYHSYSELVLFPFGYANNMTAPDHDALEELAIDMAVTIPASGGGTYTPQESWQLYAASGVTDDWVYGEHGVFSYTIELGTVFIPPASEILEICQENLQAALILLDRVNESTLTGIIRDANTNLPVVAEIFIDGVDNTGEFRKPYMSDLNFGRYYRLLVEGTYSVTFSAYGYLPQTINNVNINNLDQTLLDVYLVPAASVDISGTVTDLDTGLPIENATIEILGTPISPVQTNSNGQYSILNVEEGTYDLRVYALDYATIIESKNISSGTTVFDFQLQESFAWSFETGTFESQWIQGGNAPWTITTEDPYDGAYCSKSGNISDNQTSEMEISLVLSSGGDVSFFRKVSSEPGYDYLRFYIDGSLKGSWAGEVDWEEVAFPVSAGNHTFKWEYYKDAYVSNGSDCAWIDYIIFPPYIPFPDPANININNTAFEVSLAPDNISVQQLSISNTGDMDLTYSLTKQYITTTKSTKAFCTASGGCDEYISRVVFNTIDNSSDCSSYADYTSLSTIVIAGTTYDLTIENGNVYSSDDLGVWIDWNQDEDFDDTGENVVCSINSYGQGTFAIEIPADAISGNTTMRIRMKYSGNDCGNPCGNTTYGEVEDYTIFVNNNFTDWLTINPMNGSITGQDNQVIDLTFNSTDLEEGDYFADVEIASNDPDDPIVIVPCTLHVSAGFFMDISVQLQGAYNGSLMNSDLNISGVLPLIQPYNTSPWNYPGLESVAAIPNDNIVDWVLVELRETDGDASIATPSTIIARQAGFLLKDGSIVSIDGFTPLRFDQSITQNLFAVVLHRNHLAVISANALLKTGDTYSWDFTSIGQSFGPASQIEIAPGLWGMIAGDDNHDGFISIDDFSTTWNNNAGTSGLSDHDLNLDGQINNLDKDDYWLPNLGSGTGVPE
jgi:hypothetical protein